MKNAKKSMFITTILMVAVLIVAVSTATFAWYTASGRGEATSAELVAAESTAANIAVGWTNAATTTSITLTSKNNIAPAVPSAELTEGMLYSALSFKTAQLDNNANFQNVGDYTNIWTATDGGSNDGFYVINHNMNAAANVTMTCTIADAGDDNNNGRLVVAVFISDNADEGKMKLAGIFTNLSEYYIGSEALANTKPQSGLTTSTVGKVDGDSITFTLAKDTDSTDNYVKIQVKAWLDGQELTQENAGDSASFSFTFGA